MYWKIFFVFNLINLITITNAGFAKCKDSQDWYVLAVEIDGKDYYVRPSHSEESDEFNPLTTTPDWSRKFIWKYIWCGKDERLIYPARSDAKWTVEGGCGGTNVGTFTGHSDKTTRLVNIEKWTICGKCLYADVDGSIKVADNCDGKNTKFKLIDVDVSEQIYNYNH